MAGRVNALLVKCEDGFFFVFDLDAIIDEGRREGFLSLSGKRTGAVVTVARRLLGLERERFLNVTVGLEPAAPADEPLTAWGVGDWIWAPDERGLASRVRVKSVTYAEDDDGNVQFAPELSDPREAAAAEMRRVLERMVSGNAVALNRVGNAVSPSTIRPTDVRIPRVLEMPPFTFGGFVSASVGLSSPRYRVPMSGKVTEVTAQLLDGSAELLVRHRRGGSTIDSLVILVSDAEPTVEWWDQYVDHRQDDELSVEVTFASTDAYGLVIQPAFAAS